ncbi:MAG: cytidylate kinase-like family protein [Lentimicrobium sp.]|jgi:cytidylate kinase|nr:cytidylate kinase-like family protein [Lentimicrobium sp.]
MGNTLLKFMVDSYERRNVVEESNQTGLPFITISREHGCQGNTLAHMINAALLKYDQHWDILNKEILHETARELNLSTDHVQKVASGLDRTAIDEILNSFSVKYYKSDRKVRRTIAMVVETRAQAGKVIIVGRGGAAITRNLSTGIHIRLRAPISYRLSNMIERKGLSREQAFALLSQVDLKRFKLQRDYFKDQGDINELFDVTFDCSNVSLDEITKMIMTLLKERGFV